MSRESRSARSCRACRVRAQNCRPSCSRWPGRIQAMDCKDIRSLLEANSDGELDLVRQLELEAHLRVCPDCALQAGAIEARRDALRNSIPRLAASPQLRERIRATLRAESAPAAPSARRRAPVPLSFWNL